ncbi:MAG: protein phosphatase 2C domain-containing protein [Polyangiales bacterium]
MSFEVHSFVDVDFDRCQHLSFAGGTAVVFSSKKPGREGPNQDSASLIAIAKKKGVLVVSDGAGGHPGGARASALAIDAMQKAIGKAVDQKRDLRDGILDGFEQANKSIQAMGVGAAATLAVVEIQENQLRAYHAGDSMVLVVGQRGKIKQSTIPHSPVGYAVEAGLLDPEQALHHDDLHLVSNLLGRDDMRIELGSSSVLSARDTVVLASDGLSDNVRLEEIVAQLRSGPLSRRAGVLADLAQKRMVHPDEGAPSKPDDLTFIAFRRAGKARNSSQNSE